MNKLKWFPLFTTNFTGVLNDNVLKTLIGFVCVTWIGADTKSTLVSLAAALLVLPYIFLSPWAGKLAKEHKKNKIIQRAKFAEIPIMIAASLGFILHSVYLVMIAMFVMGLQSCIYSPSKYGIIRDIGGVKGISFGTGAMEMITFVAVLLGTFLGGYISDIPTTASLINKQVIILTISVMLLAVIGWITSLLIHPQESSTEDDSEDTLNPFKFPIRWYKWCKNIHGLNYSVLGLSVFWFIGSIIQMNLYIYCEEKLHISNTETGTIMALVAIGIGLGCYLAGVFSNHKVNTKLVIIGGIGMFLAMLLILILPVNQIIFTILIILFAFFAGFFKIPLNAFIQDKVKGRELGPVLAYNNQMVFVAILIASFVFGVVEKTMGTISVFVVVLLVTAIITYYMYTKLPGAGKVKAHN